MSLIKKVSKKWRFSTFITIFQSCNCNVFNWFEIRIKCYVFGSSTVCLLFFWNFEVTVPKLAQKNIFYKCVWNLKLASISALVFSFSQGQNHVTSTLCTVGTVLQASWKKLFFYLLMASFLSVERVLVICWTCTVLI